MVELRDEIVKKSFLQFLNRGYKATSLKDLEQATGLTKGAFYYYFKDKQEILEAGIERYFSVMREETDEDVERVASLREYIDLVIRNKEEGSSRRRKEPICRRNYSGVLFWKCCFSSWCWRWHRCFPVSGNGFTRCRKCG